MIRIFKDIDEISHYAARSFFEIAHRSVSERGRVLVALSGGSTPGRFYELLGVQSYNEVDWTRVHFFWGDERCVPADDPGNNYGQVKRALFDRLNIPAINIHPIQTDLEPEEAAMNYAQTLKAFSDPPLQWPRFDLVLLGMGDDGHTASLFPGSPMNAHPPILAVTESYQGRPSQRVTLTHIVFNSARHVFFLVSGASKALSLSEVLHGKFNPLDYPAQRISPEGGGEISWLVDRDAASLLPEAVL